MSLLDFFSGLHNPPDYVFQPMYLGEFWEFFNLAMWFVLVTYCYKVYGKWITIKIFAIGMVYGMVLENGGPLMIPELGFQGYFWEETYRLYLFEFFGYGIRISKVPIATHLGWTNVFFMGYLFYEKISHAYPSIREGKVKSVLLGFLIITMSGWMRDLQLDPVATRYRWWTWNQNLLPLWFGVPLVNYVAWFWAVGTFGGAWVLINNITQPKAGEQASGDIEKVRAKKLFFSLPLVWIIDTIGVMATVSVLDLFGLMYV
jgi:hypothetical protein